MKSGDSGQMVKSISTICGINELTFSTEQFRLLCALLKLTGYHSKPNAELLHIIAVGKIINSLYQGEENTSLDAKALAKKKNSPFLFIYVHFSDGMSPTFWLRRIKT